MNIFITQCTHFLREVHCDQCFQSPYILFVSAWLLEALTQDKEHIEESLECLSRTLERQARHHYK